MRTSQKTLEPIATIGVDLGKNTFHLVGLDKRGAIVLQQKVSRGQLERRLANIPRCLIGNGGLLGLSSYRPPVGGAWSRRASRRHRWWSRKSWFCDGATFAMLGESGLKVMGRSRRRD
jgi:hypothetical protein